MCESQHELTENFTCMGQMRQLKLSTARGGLRKKSNELRSTSPSKIVKARVSSARGSLVELTEPFLI